MSTGYSGTPQIKKLGITPGCRLLVDHAPEGWQLDHAPTTEPVIPGGAADVVLTFVHALDDLAARVESFAPRIHPAGALWIAWPRKAAGHRSDVTENAIRDVALPHGLVDVKVAAIDADWSGLKVVWRRENRSRKNLG